MAMENESRREFIVKNVSHERLKWNSGTFCGAAYGVMVADGLVTRSRMNYMT